MDATIWMLIGFYVMVTVLFATFSPWVLIFAPFMLLGALGLGLIQLHLWLAGSIVLAMAAAWAIFLILAALVLTLWPAASDWLERKLDRNGGAA